MPPKAGRCPSASRPIRLLVTLWIAQNVLLVASTMLRTLDYVEAYSLTELDAALRRAGARTAAREPLRRALDLAARCGATPLGARARAGVLARFVEEIDTDDAAALAAALQEALRPADDREGTS